MVNQREKAKKIPPHEKRRAVVIATFNQRIAQCKAVPAQVKQLRDQFNTYHAGGEGKATIHYRVFLKAGDHQVDLLTTEPAEVDVE